jgi:hypothetical protein
MPNRLDASHIIATLDRLALRVDERFPNAGLGRVATDLAALSREAAAASAALQRPYWVIRIGVGSIVFLGAALLVLAMRGLRVPRGIDSVADMLQTIESGINDAVFLGLAIYFLISLEQRIKRRRALALIHRLRSIAHIVDMHQLTKDPDRVRADRTATASSPRPELSLDALGRYLDYCSELLSLTSKIAALFGERRSDPVVLAAVNEVEQLATGLSTKIWQKITILNNAKALTPRSSAPR